MGGILSPERILGHVDALPLVHRQMRLRHPAEGRDVRLAALKVPFFSEPVRLRDDLNPEIHREVARPAIPVILVERAERLPFRLVGKWTFKQLSHVEPTRLRSENVKRRTVCVDGFRRAGVTERFAFAKEHFSLAAALHRLVDHVRKLLVGDCARQVLELREEPGGRRRDAGDRRKTFRTDYGGFQRLVCGGRLGIRLISVIIDRKQVFRANRSPEPIALEHLPHILTAHAPIASRLQDDDAFPRVRCPIQD